MSTGSIDGFRSLARAPAVLVATSEFSEAGPLSDTEAAYISAAVESRREDFATGRRCAVEALGLLGVEVPSLERGEGREPVWPEGTIGSITHTEGLCAAAVAPSAGVRFLGMDAEPNVPLKDKLLERISSETEREALARIGGSGFSSKTLFSAKESIFKALYPEVRAYFGFEEVEITADPDTGMFEAILAPMLRGCVGLELVRGRYVTTPEHTMTIVQVSR